MKRGQLQTGIGAALGMMVLILDGKTALAGAREGIELCLVSVIPSLFPFFVLSMLITNSFSGAELPLLRPLGKLFSLPKGGESLLVPAFLGGYPVGARCVSDAWRGGKLETAQAQRMLAFCSNAGPAFLFGMAGQMFPEKWMAWALWGIHIAGAWTVSALVPCDTASMKGQTGKEPSPSSLMSAAVTVMLQVCGWVVLFRVVLAFLNRWILWLLPVAGQVALTGFLELSNGCCNLMRIEDVSLRFMVCSGILAWGGLCVTMQTASVCQGLSMKYYFLGKAMQTVLSLLFSAAVAAGYYVLIPLVLVTAGIIRWKKRKNSSIFVPAGV